MKYSEERELFAAAGMLPPALSARPEPPRLRTYMRLFSENRWYIALITAVAVALGTLAAMAMPPMYQANLLVQIAEAGDPSKSILGEKANVFDIKTPASAEMEIMRSRMVVGPAIEENCEQVSVELREFPYISGVRFRTPSILSSAIAEVDGRSTRSAPAMVVRQFDVPAAYQEKTFVAKVEQEGRYSLRHPSFSVPLQGRVGELLTGNLGNQRFSLLVSQLTGDKGTEFNLVRRSRAQAIEEVQDRLKLAERGRQSGIVELLLTDTDAARAAATLNAIGANYVRQAIDRKSAEAEKTLAFMSSQLPGLKQEMERAERAYNSFRSRKGAVALEQETRLELERSSELRDRLATAQQNRRDLLSRYGPQHPAVISADEQISAMESSVRRLQSRITQLPSTQQDAFTLERDMKLSGELYQQLRHSAMQLQLVRQGLTGNVRIIDSAVVPEKPVRPQSSLVLGVAAASGLVLSALFVLMRSALSTTVRSAREIEAGTGLSVYSSAIPLSRSPFLRDQVVALSDPSEDAAVGLRQLRTLLLNPLRERSNNLMLITGPTRGVGVHFIAANLAAIMSMEGRRILLIDADRLHGNLHRTFDLAPTPGLTELVSGACTRKQAIRSTRVANLDLVTAGSAGLDFNELAGSQPLRELLEHASKNYDVVLLAAPPVLRSADTLSLAASAATVVVVARARKTAVDQIAESARHLAQAGRSPSGVVLNAV